MELDKNYLVLSLLSEGKANEGACYLDEKCCPETPAPVWPLLQK